MQSNTRIQKSSLSQAKADLAPPQVIAIGSGGGAAKRMRDSGASNLAGDHDASLRAFCSLLSSAIASSDGVRSIEAADANGRNQQQQRAAAIPHLFADEVLRATHSQIQQGGSKDGDIDEGIWWLVSIPSLDLRNKSKPISSMLSRSLDMSPAILAAFSLSLPLRALCADDSSIHVACGRDKNPVMSLTALPRRTLLNIGSSYEKLVESRLRSSLSALLKVAISQTGGGINIPSRGRANNNDGRLRSQTVELINLLSKPNAVVVTAAVSKFKIVEIPGGSTDEGLDESGHLRGRTVPLIFEAVLDVCIHGTKSTAVLRAPGSLTGQFVSQSEQMDSLPRLARAEITIDAPHLLQEMMKEARKAVKLALSTAATNVVSSSKEQEGKRSHGGVKVMQHSLQKRTVLLKNSVEHTQGSKEQNGKQASSHNVLKKGGSLYGSSSSDDDAMPRTVSLGGVDAGIITKRQSIYKNSILPVPPQGVRRCSELSSSSVTDDESSFHSAISSSNTFQSSADLEQIMPPPRPRSPLSMSRSSSRILFHRKTASAGDVLPHSQQNFTSVPKSERKNASWEKSSSSLDGKTSSIGTSSSSAATAAGFALLRKPNSAKGFQGDGTNVHTRTREAGKRKRSSETNLPLRKRRFHSCPS